MHGIHGRTGGFTLVELMIVITIVSVLASVAIPNLIRGKMTSNEAAAIATLKTIASAQAQCQISGAIDVNGNGLGEYGYLGELSGSAPLRSDQAGGVGSAAMSPPLLSAAFGKILSGRALRSGYWFQVYLPDANGQGLPEAAAGGAAGVSVSASFAENAWFCYAWPSVRGSSGNRAFFVSQSGEVLGCRNTIARYSGTARTPDWRDALVQGAGNVAMNGTIAANATGMNAERWLVVN